MFRSFRLFKLFGIDIKLNMSLLLLLLFFIRWDFEALPYDVLKFVMLFVMVLLHELGHALTAKYFGLPCDNITLHGLGGAAMIDKLSTLSLRKQFFVILNGPLVNVVLMILSGLYVGYYLDFHDGIMQANSLDSVAANFFIVNIVMLVFNLLPIYPMDGGRLFRFLLQWLKVPNYPLVTNVFGIVVAIFALLFFLYIGAIVGSLIMILGIVILIYSIKNQNVEL